MPPAPPIVTQTLSHKRQASVDTSGNAPGPPKRRKPEPGQNHDSAARRPRRARRDRGKGKGKATRNSLVEDDASALSNNRRTLPSSRAGGSEPLPTDTPSTLASSDQEHANHSSRSHRTDGASTSYATNSGPTRQSSCSSSSPSQELGAAKLALLQKELDAKDRVLQKYQDTFSSLQGILQCQICLEIMWDPYMPGSKLPGLEEKLFPGRKAAQPVVPPFEPVQHPEAVGGDPSQRHPTGPNQVPPDPWAGLFPTENIRFPAYIAERAGAAGVIVDEEDNVARCGDCFYEVYNGVCENCGRVFDGFHHEGGLTDEEDYEDGENNPLGPVLHWGVPNLEDEYSEDDEDEDEEDEEEMDDFIEQDENAGARVLHHLWGHGPGGRSDDEGSWQGFYDGPPPGDDERSVSEEIRALSEDPQVEEYRQEQARDRERYMYGDGEYLERGRPAPSRSVSGNRPPRFPPPGDAADDDDEDEDDEIETELEIIGSRRRGRHSIMLISSDPEDEPDDAWGAPRRTQTRRPIYDQEEDEVEEISDDGGRSTLDNDWGRPTVVDDEYVFRGEASEDEGGYSDGGYGDDDDDGDMAY
ncbi:hypothetical protein FRB99_000394 [Tulasnella sp. 403]|nr:hypothetical protein FRB99_000394 [Tulasnella sp. 403]